MLKRLFTLLLAVLLISCTAAAVRAEDASVTLNGFSFTINSDGNAVIHSYDGRSNNVVIPKTLMNAKVTEIDDYAFFENTEMTSVSFEKADNLRRIGTNAFYGCTSLKSVDLPSGVTEIGFGAFQSCSQLESATLGGVTAISEQCFYKCEKLKRVAVPSSVEKLGERCFAGCDLLEDVEILDGVTEIAANAFENSDKVVIYCYKDSYAAEFAEDYNVPMRDITLTFKNGDANLDGDIDILDVTLIQKYKINAAELPLYRGKHYADVNGDNKVTVRDATYIQMYIAQMIEL